jgi:cytochrome c553
MPRKSDAYSNLCPCRFRFVSGTVFAVSPAVKTVTKPCAGCHVPVGVSITAKTPNLNSQGSEYFEEKISGLANVGWKSGIPDHGSNKLTGAEISAVAKIFAAGIALRPV